MTNEYITKEKLIQLLDDAIENEIQKPTEETDMEFVTECEHLINALMGNEHIYSDEDAERYFAEIMKKKNVKKNTFFIRSKRVIAASIAFFIIFLGGITLYASSPVVREFIHKTLNWNIGQAAEEGGITYINYGQNIRYKNIEELIKNENLDIKYPEYIPYNATIEKILYTEADNSLYFTFSDDRIQFSITLDADFDEMSFTNLEKITINDINFFIFSKNKCFVANAVIDNKLYTLQCDSKKELLNMINTLK